MATIVTGDQYEKLDGKLCEIKRQMRQKEGYPFDPDQLDRALQAIIEGRFEAFNKDEKPKEVKPPVHESYSVFVDYSRTLPTMIEMARFDTVYRNMDKNYKVEKPNLSGEAVASGSDPYRMPGYKGATTEIVLICMNDMVVTKKELDVYVSELGLRHARIEEFLALCEKCPDLQRKGVIEAHGSIWEDSDGKLQVPILSTCGGRLRFLGMNHIAPGRTYGSSKGATWQVYLVAVRE